ncbi:hypothetical protein [Algibacter sp. R77976]|uniref:hypothetical protein n=1 Tax=Algibacter sp. R77976 TaxID=3093873 RepID=UPI0037CC4C10
MGAVELKQIITQYLNTADEKVLKLVKAVFETYQEDKEDFFDNLPKEVQELLKESKDDIKKGAFFTHEDVLDEFKEKYNITLDLKSEI